MEDMKEARAILFVMERTARGGMITAKILGMTPGWDRVRAWRYLELLSSCGWLEKVKDGKGNRYLIGPKVLGMVPSSFRI